MFTTGIPQLDADIADTNNTGVTIDSVFTDITHITSLPSNFLNRGVDTRCGDPDSRIENLDYSIGFTITTNIPRGYSGNLSLGFKPTNQFPDGVDVIGIGRDRNVNTQRTCQTPATRDPTYPCYPCHQSQPRHQRNLSTCSQDCRQR